MTYYDPNQPVKTLYTQMEQAIDFLMQPTLRLPQVKSSPGHTIWYSWKDYTMTPVASGDAIYRPLKPGPISKPIILMRPKTCVNHNWYINPRGDTAPMQPVKKKTRNKTGGFNKRQPLPCPNYQLWHTWIAPHWLACRDSLPQKKTKNQSNPADKNRYKNVNYCWKHLLWCGKDHTSASGKWPKKGHRKEATKANKMGGSEK